MPRRSRRPTPALPARTGPTGDPTPGRSGGRTACIAAVLTVGLTTGATTATVGPAFADQTGDLTGAHLTSRVLALDFGLRPATTRGPLLLQRVPRKPRRVATHGAARTVGTIKHGTDTGGGDGSASDRDLALAATWQLDPTLLQPQPGDSAATLAARTELAGVAARLRVVMARYNKAHAAAQNAAATATKARTELKEAQLDAAGARRVYMRDHRLLIQLVRTSYEEGPGPLTSIQFLLAADNAHDLMVGMGTMQQVGSNQASVVTDAEVAAAAMRVTEARAQRAAEVARTADQRAEDTLAAATRASQKVLDKLAKARRVLTLSVLADQLQTNLADAMKYAKQLKPGSVSFPLPPNSGFYDNHNWGERSAHWATIHTGDDYSVACGTPVLAATAGKIVILTDQSWAGRWLVLVSTGHGRLTTWYAHMEELAVKAGQHVKPGQIIGRVGEAGNATGCHLHFELHPDGGSIYQDTTDPDPWLKAVGAYPGS